MRNMVLLYAALADENRLRLLGLLERGELCVCHLQTALQTNQPKISRHLAYLRKAGLVKARKDGKWMYYRLHAPDQDVADILAETLGRLKGKLQIQKDNQRLKKVQCA